MVPASRPAAIFGPAARFVRAGLRITRPDWLRLGALVLLSSISGGLEVLLLGLLAALIVGMMGTHISVFLPSVRGTSEAVTPFVAGGLLALLAALAFPIARLGATLSTDAMARTRERLLRAYHSASLSYRDSHRENYLAQLTGENCNRSEQLVQHLVTALSGSAILLVFLAAAAWVAPMTTLALLGGLSLFTLLVVPLLHRVRRHRQVNTLMQREMITQVGQLARLSDMIAAFHVGARVAAVLDSAGRAAARTVSGLRYENRLLPSLYQYGGLALVLGIILLPHVTYSRDYPGIAPLAFLLVRALGYVRSLFAAVQNGIEQVPFTEILADELAALERHPAPTGTLSPSQFPGLRFESAGYSYRSGKPALTEVTFEIHPGEVVGLVGPSGGGKSTLASLMLRLRMPTQGRLLAGGMPLEDVRADAWASLSALVSQDSRLIHATVADNIRFFRPEFGLSRVKAAAAAAHVDAEIVALPEGYETMVGIGARDLSGGQRQRLAIARALLGRPQFLVLDEPTSALDKASEHLLVQTLQELKGQVTIVVIAHRPDTIAMCDRVLHVEGGRVRELTPAAP